MANDEQGTDGPAEGLSRRQVLARGAVAAGIVWAAPVIRTASAYATSAAGTERPCSKFYLVCIDQLGARPVRFVDSVQGLRRDAVGRDHRPVPSDRRAGPAEHHDHEHVEHHHDSSTSSTTTTSTSSTTTTSTSTTTTTKPFKDPTKGIGLFPGDEATRGSAGRARPRRRRTRRTRPRPPTDLDDDGLPHARGRGARRSTISVSSPRRPATRTRRRPRPCRSSTRCRPASRTG